jgi:molybdopterin converting factor small subunit
MTQVMIPTPLRAYTRGQRTVTVPGATVDDALSALTAAYPDLKRHLFNDEGKLRNFVNIYLGEEDVRYLRQGATALCENDTLSIVPSIAGGAGSERKVDHSALRTNQAFIITLLLLAFIADVKWLVAFVSAAMLIGTAFPNAALFQAVYRYILRPLKIVRPDVRVDNPEPHLFAQGVGGTFLLAATVGFIARVPALGWVLSWIVVALTALNLFAGICVGCLMYYWLNRLGVPGFKHARIHSAARFAP